MAKKTTQFLCTECGDSFLTWQGKCSSCGSFNTLKEFRESPILTTKGDNILGIDLNLQKNNAEIPVSHQPISRIKTGIEEVDRVLGGGFFPESLVLFGGHPGIGKSTLALQIFCQVANAFYFSGEESLQQIHGRAKRLNPDNKNLSKNIFSTNSLEDIATTIEKNRPNFAVIDSIQMIGSGNSTFGSIAQVKENAEVLLRLAKSIGTTILIIGHVTKSDELAGPKALEHLVDCILQLEGERNSEIRILRSPKNRFGSTLELGVFEMRQQGLQELKNPSEFFLSERAENAFGSVISVVREGVRNFLLEIQVLMIKTNFGNPRRTAHGVEIAKFHLLLAVVSKFTPFKCDSFDAYINIVGGFKIQDPAADLAICAAILSSRSEKEIPAHTIIMGEVGLSGEVRNITNIESRLSEAAKLGFKKAIIPKLPPQIKKPKNIEIQEVKSVLELMNICLKK